MQAEGTKIPSAFSCTEKIKIHFVKPIDIG